MIPIAMTIAWADPSGRARRSADLKTFHQQLVYGCSVVTLLTIQNRQTDSAIKVLDCDFELGQLRCAG